MRFIFGFILIIFSVTSNAIEPYNCRNGAFPTYEGIMSAEIKAESGEKIHARNDWEGCPEKDKCIRKGYILNGDKVLATPESDGWVCVYYLGKKSDYVGYVPKVNVKAIQIAENQDVKNWLGVWKSLGGEYADTIAIKSGEQNELHVSGNAYWYGGKNTYDEQIVHIGGVDGISKPEGNKLVVMQGEGKYSCVVNMQLLLPFLVVTDNSYCGGMNVRFNGIYKKMP